jgi:hypothetical protein
MLPVQALVVYNRSLHSVHAHVRSTVWYGVYADRSAKAMRRFLSCASFDVSLLLHGWQAAAGRCGRWPVLAVMAGQKGVSYLLTDQLEGCCARVQH